jgi:hypothetical protein
LKRKLANVAARPQDGGAPILENYEQKLSGRHSLATLQPLIVSSKQFKGLSIFSFDYSAIFPPSQAKDRHDLSSFRFVVDRLAHIFRSRYLTMREPVNTIIMAIKVGRRLRLNLLFKESKPGILNGSFDDDR